MKSMFRRRVRPIWNYKVPMSSKVFGCHNWPGKTDLIPNRTNYAWIDPREPGIYLGNCAEYCGTQHANMLLRVVAQAPEISSGGRRTTKGRFRKCGVSVAFVRELPCSQKGRLAVGKFGPDLTHLMSRQTLAAGAITNTPENLRSG